MASPYTLHVTRGGETVATHDIEGDVVKIGRLASAHLRLDDPKVSRIHAVLEVGEDGSIAVIDMGSAQGTLVNGKRINKVALQPGDRIIVGDTAIELQAAGAQVAAETGASDDEAGAPSGSAPGVAVAAEATPDDGADDGADEPAVNEAASASNEVVVEAASSNQAVNQAVSAAPARNEVASNQVATNEAVSPGFAAAVLPGQAPATLPAPWPAAGRGMELDLHVRLVWGDQPLEAASFSDEEQITLGGEDATFSVDPGGLDGERIPLAKQEGGSWTLIVPEGAMGAVETEQGSETLASLISAGRASRGEGGYEVSIGEDAVAWFNVGNVRAEFFFRPRRRQVVTKWSESLDYGYLNILLVAFFLTAAGVVAFENMETSRVMTADDLFANRARFTKFLLQPEEKKERNPFLQRLKELKEPEQAVRAPGEEGQMGKRDAPPVQRRSAPRAVDPTDEETIKNQGILSMLGKGGGGLSTVLGAGGLGGELKGAIGGLAGATVGDAQGFGGLGLRGEGPGGGAVGETVSVGAIGTRGRGGGSESFGAGVGGLGKKESADVRIDTSAVSVTGTIDRELIRRVIQQNHGRFKYCYESELVRNPNLSGRIAIQFQIASTGRVSLARVDSSTMGNARVENCIASRIRQLTFPMPEGGGAALATYPFVFSPSGE